jgi:signal transduction histidine kinase
MLGFLAAQMHPRWVVSLHNTMLMAGGAVLVTAGVSVIRRSLSPFDELRERLGAVRDGRSGRLDGEYPDEVAPLVNDLNALLEERERRVARAVARAGDLAHGLKTPLAILMQEIEVAQSSGQHDLARSMRQQVERMRHQIDSHLAQARATAAGRAPGSLANVAEVVRAVVRTVDRLYVERALGITTQISPDHTVRVPAEDLEEMLGNLLDNACKWGRSHVYFAASIASQDAALRRRLTITVEDDGPGLSPEQRAKIGKRGLRLDETKPGSGLGLSIVSDLASSYHGGLALEASQYGGLKVVLELPAA